MLNAKQEKEFQEMVEIGINEMETEIIAGQPDPRAENQFPTPLEDDANSRKEYWENVLEMYEDIPEPKMTQRVKTAPGIEGEVKCFGSFQEEINGIYFIDGEPEPQHEAVDKPSHYNFFGIDTMPMLEKILGTEGYLGFLQGNALKYRLRVGKKKGNSIEQDVAKAMYYEDLYNNFVLKNTPS